jgi:hypothetical protein
MNFSHICDICPALIPAYPRVAYVFTFRTASSGSPGTSWNSAAKDDLRRASYGYILEVMNERLKLIAGEEALVLDPTDGHETLGQATDVFRYIDHNFGRWNCNVVGPPTKETAVRVFEMIRNSTFQELFGGFGAALDSLALTQGQIKQFAKCHRDWLQEGGNGTFFLFKSGNEFFVAAYFFSDGQIGMRLRRLTLERVFRAQKHHRLVVKSAHGIRRRSC